MMEYNHNLTSDGNDINLIPSNFTNYIDHNRKDSYEKYYEENNSKYSDIEPKNIFIEISQHTSSDAFIVGKIENNKEILKEDVVTHKNEERDLLFKKEKKK